MLPLEEHLLLHHANRHVRFKTKLTTAACKALGDPTEALHECVLLLAILQREGHVAEGLPSVEEQHDATPQQIEGREHIMIDGLARRESLHHMEAEGRGSPFGMDPLLPQERRARAEGEAGVRPIPRDDVRFALQEREGSVRHAPIPGEDARRLRRTSLQYLLL